MAATVLITGATSGIGLELARIYAAAGRRLILVGRRPAAELAADLFAPDRYCQVDLAEADAHLRVAAWCAERGIDTLDLLVHNAAAGWYGHPAAQPAGSIRQLVQVNLKAPIALTHALLPLLARARGQISFISSVASALPAPEYAVYTATKAALDGFARSLRPELAEAGIRVQVIHPGATNTGMHPKIGISPEKMDWNRFPSAADVTAMIARAIDRGGRNVPIGLGNRALRRAGLLLGRHMEPLVRRGEPVPLPADWPQPEAAAPAGHVLITGAADGIGRALAVEMAGGGAALTGVDFDRERAEETMRQVEAAGGQIAFYFGDLAAPDSLDGLLEQLAAGLPPVSVLINNAGISATGPFRHLSLAEQLRVVDVNLTAPLLLTTRLWAAGRLTEQGMLVFVSSLSRYTGYPGAAVYGATKDGLASFAASLNGLPGSERRSLVVYPGPTRTAHARRYSPDNSREERRMPPEQVAAAIGSAVAGRRRILMPGTGAKLFALIGWLLPPVMERGMKGILYDKMAAAAFPESPPKK